MRHGVSHNQQDLQLLQTKHIVPTLLFSIHSVCLFLVSPYKYKSSASPHEFPRWKGIFHTQSWARQCASCRLNCRYSTLSLFTFDTWIITVYYCCNIYFAIFICILIVTMYFISVKRSYNINNGCPTSLSFNKIQPANSWLQADWDSDA